MFRNATLGARIGFGFAILSILAIIVGGTGYLGLSRVLGVTEFYKNTNVIKGIVASVKEETDQYLLYNYAGAREKQETVRERAFSQIERGQGFIREMLASSALDKEGKERLDNAGKELSRYGDAMKSYVAAETNKIGKVKEAHAVSVVLAETIMKGELWVDELRVAHEVLTADMDTYFNRPLESAWQKVTPGLEKLGKAADNWYSKVENSDDLRAIGDTLKKLVKDLEAALVQYHKEVIEQDGYRALMDKHKNNVEEICAQLDRTSAERLRGQARASQVWVFSVIGVTLLIAVLYSFITIRNIVHRTRKVVDGVSEGTDQITTASGQVSSASQSLAEAASEQASSIEETSASLEEMASMTRQNVEHSKEAMSLVGTSTEKLKEANDVMKSLIESMERTSAASDEVAKIIKTIDEIAFQTNLLALNAAVEAARAGEAGAGFSVVAEEVRNLAMRSSEASLNTQELIMDVIKKIKEGTGLVERTDGCYREVAVNVQKVNDLMNEIVGASQEQSQGIEEINRAVAEMDKVTQQNATNAEESASASEEMNAQARQMKDVVADLITLVGGNGNDGVVRDRKHAVNRAERDTGSGVFPGLRKTLPSPVGRGKEIRPEAVIPMEEDDFKDF